MAGLPRSGSTALSALLNQHPNIYASPQTDLLSMMYSLHSQIPNYESYRAGLLHTGFDSVLKQLPKSFYSNISKPVIIDKNRAWGTPYNWNNLSTYLNPQGKVILTMRPILEVLASFVKITKTSQKTTGQLQSLNKDLWVSDYRNEVDAICDNLMIANGQIDQAIFSIYNLIKNHKEKIHVVWYNDLIESPEQTMEQVYKFLELPSFDNNFDNIQEADKHDDLFGYNIIGLHEIKKKLSKSTTKPSSILSNYAIRKYENALDFLNL